MTFVKKKKIQSDSAVRGETYKTSHYVWREMLAGGQFS